MLVALILLLVLLLRVVELDRSQKHARRLLARGGREHGAGHYALLLAAHGTFYLALALECADRPPPADLWLAAWLGVLVLAQVARQWVLATLGERWTARVIQVPGAPLVRSGPYRFLRHPEYIAGLIELIAIAVGLRAWITLAVGLVSQIIVLQQRLAVEDSQIDAQA